MRRARRAWPASEGCFARDSSRRSPERPERGRQRGSADARRGRRSDSSVSRIAGLVEKRYSAMTVRSILDRRAPAGATSTSCSPTASRGASRRASWAGSAGSSSRSCATCRSALLRLFADVDLSDAEAHALPEPARLLRARAQAGRAAGRSGSRPCWSAPATRSSGRAAGSTAARCSRPRVRLHAGGAASAIRRPARALPRRHLRHAAAHRQHVPPLPRAARLPRRAGRPTSRATPGT